MCSFCFPLLTCEQLAQRSEFKLMESNFFKETNGHFTKMFGISIEEAGFSEEAFKQRYGDLSPLDAAHQIGRDYDLDRIDLGWN